MKEDEANKIAQALIAESRMEDAAAYLERGRPYKDLSKEQLEQAWAAAFELYMGLNQQEQQHLYRDLAAEFQLRDIEPPTHLVKETLKKLEQRVANMSPEGRDAARDAIGALLGKWEKPKN
ncbi:MAG: hypothetical protein ACOY4R_09425 [Pseudomonadota bacterium]